MILSNHTRSYMILSNHAMLPISHTRITYDFLDIIKESYKKIESQQTVYFSYG